MFGHVRRSQEQYVEFRFEDWLRKYEPVPRKRVKQHCKNCLKKSAQLSQENRMNRLCETRRKFLLASREQASEYSKRRQAAESGQADKQNRVVSDFAFGDSEQDHKCESGSRIYQQSNIQAENRQISQPLFVETPFKEGIQQQIQKQTQQILEEMEADIHQKKSRIIKDIDFHIQMVNQLHNQILQQGSQESQQQCSFQDASSINSDAIGVEDGPQLHQASASEMKDEQQECEHESLSSNAHLQQHEANESITDKISRLQIGKKSYRTSDLQMIESAVPFGGRVQVQGATHECYLSSRVLYKLCLQNADDPETVKLKLMKRHPYLGDPSAYIGKMLDSNQCISL